MFNVIILLLINRTPALELLSRVLVHSVHHVYHHYLLLRLVLPKTTTYGLTYQRGRLERFHQPDVMDVLQVDTRAERTVRSDEHHPIATFYLRGVQLPVGNL